MQVRALRKQILDAVRRDTPAQVATLLARHPDLADARNAHGNTPIRDAIGVRRPAVVALLLDRGADPTQVNHGGSSLMDAATAAGVPGKARRCWWPAGAACAPATRPAWAYWPNCVLCSMNARPRPASATGVGGTPLHAAARGDQAEAARLLLDRGADAGAVNRHGHPPLADAVEANALAAAAMLLDRGASPDCRAGHFGGSALHRAIANRHKEMARLLLDRGADPSRRDHAGKTALHDAVIAGTVAWVELVLAYRPDLTSRTRHGPTQPGGETALDYARRRRKPALIRLLQTRSAADPLPPAGRESLP